MTRSAATSANDGPEPKQLPPAPQASSGVHTNSSRKKAPAPQSPARNDNLQRTPAPQAPKAQ
jgi:hypothetical protein